MEIEVWIAVDSDETVIVASNEDDLDYSDLNGLNRTICLKLTINSPKEQVFSASVPDQASGEVKLTLTEGE